MQLRDSISTVPCGALLAAGAQTSLAAETINLDAAPLNHALMNFATMCGITITVPADLARNRMSEPLRGKRCGEPALQRLLQGSGLSYRRRPTAALRSSPWRPGLPVVQPSYELVNMRFGMDLTDRLAVVLSIDNVLDERPVLDTVELGAPNGYITSTSRPRTYGLTFRYSGR